MSTKLNLRKASKRIAEDFKKAESPDTWVDKAGPGHSNKAGSSKLSDKSTVDKKYATKVDTKFGRKGQSVNTSHPADNFVSNKTPSYKKETKFVPAKDIKPKDAKKPSMSGFEGAAGETLGKPRIYQKVTTLQQNELVNGFLQGFGPKAASFVTLKGKVANGSGMKEYKIKESAGQLFSPNGTVQTLISEGVFNGTVVITYGTKKMVFEGASIDPIREFIKSLVNVGQRVNVDCVGGFRAAYDVPAIYENILRGVHAGRGGQRAIRNERLAEAFAHFKTHMSKEFTPFLFESRATWVSNTVRPAFKQAVKSFTAMYESMCRPYMVTVKAETTKGMELFQVTAKSLSEEHAAAQAVDKIMESTGPKTSIKGVMVDAKKYAPELVHATACMMPKFVTGPGFDDGNKANMKGKSKDGPEPKAPSADKFSFGKAATPPKTTKLAVSKKTHTSKPSDF